MKDDFYDHGSSSSSSCFHFSPSAPVHEVVVDPSIVVEVPSNPNLVVESYYVFLFICICILFCFIPIQIWLLNPIMYIFYS